MVFSYFRECREQVAREAPVKRIFRHDGGPFISLVNKYRDGGRTTTLYLADDSIQLSLIHEHSRLIENGSS